MLVCIERVLVSPLDCMRCFAETFKKKNPFLATDFLRASHIVFPGAFAVCLLKEEVLTLDTILEGR